MYTPSCPSQVSWHDCAARAAGLGGAALHSHDQGNQCANTGALSKHYPKVCAVNVS